MADVVVGIYLLKIILKGIKRNQHVLGFLQLKTTALSVVELLREYGLSRKSEFELSSLAESTAPSLN